MSVSSFEDPFLQFVLNKIAEKEGFIQPKFAISLGSKPGDNYCGRIYRAVITERETNNGKSVSIILKASPLSKTRRERTNSNETFRTEAFVYQTLLPTLNNILNKYSVVKSDIFPGTARCFASHLDDDPIQVLVLEDKSTEGFRMIESKRLDGDHCRLILKYLALWHAASLALKHHEPEVVEQFQRTITKSIGFTDVNDPFMDELKQSASEGLLYLQEPYRRGNEIYRKLENIVENYRTELAGSNEIPNDLSCVIHGDCWFNNVLYKYNKDGTLNDVCLIDHQITRMGSPAVDLSYMMFLCTTKEVRNASYDELIRFYHDEVSSHLRTMNCDPEKIIPWELLQDHLRRYGKMGVLAAIACMHICLVDGSENSVDLSSAENDHTVFAGRTKTSNPEKLKDISERLTGIVEDGLRWGYI